MPAKLLRIASISDMRLILLLGLICPDLTGENANFVLVDIDEHLSAKDLPHNPLLVEIVEEHCRVVPQNPETPSGELDESVCLVLI